MDTLYQMTNKFFGLLSMYFGMLLGLASIWLVALIYSFFGWLHFSPLEMIVSLAVLMVSTGMASWLCGVAFGVRAHGISSMITAFILALIFTPTLELNGLLTLVLVGIIAGASKYILAFRGRHIFNPAAIAAVIIGFTSLGSASWWVATPSLAWVVLATALVAVYKSKQWRIFLTFLVVSTSLLSIILLQNDVPLFDIPVLLLSWPLLFLGGIMLTEPLTLPSRKWQLYVEGALVGVLVAVPFQVGWFEMNPDTALIIGNIFAAIVTRRRAVWLTFKSRRSLTPTTQELVFEPSVPVHFNPGQFMELTLPLARMDFRGERRSFSVTSLPGADKVTFGVKFYHPSSAFKNALKTIKKGTVLAVANYGGDFVLPADTTKPLLFVAGGIGVTPFISQLKAVKQAREERDITVVYCISSADELAYQKVLEKSGANIVIISPEKPKSMPKNWKYVKGSRLTETTLEKALTDVHRRHAFISGPPPFVRSVRSLLRKNGIRRVHADYFVGY